MNTENDLRRTLKARLDNVHGPQQPTSQVRQKVALQRTLGIVSMVALTMVASVGAWAGFNLLEDRRDPARVVPAGTGQAESCEPEPFDRPGHVEVLSDIVGVACGSEEDAQWTLSAFIGIVDAGNSDPQRSLCLAFGTAPGLDAGYDCFGGLQEGPPQGTHAYFIRSDKIKGSTSLVGVVSNNVGELQLELIDGSSREVALVRAPDSLGGIKVFTAIAPADSDEALIMRSATGEVIERKNTKTPAG